MRQYGILKKTIQLVKTPYETLQCSFRDEGDTTGWFQVTTGVKQGCCMSGFLFPLIIDWVMQKK